MNRDVNCVSDLRFHFPRGRGNITTRWYDDDVFWDAISPILFGDERWGDAARREVVQVLKLLDATPGSRVLDLCCGPGRHTLELARLGYQVTAVDRTATYLDEGRRRADQQGLSVEFVRASMLDFRRNSGFDAVLNLFTSFGFFESDAEERLVLANVFESLKPGSRFVIDILGTEVLARNFQTRSWQSTADGSVLLLEERKVRNGWGIVDNRWVVLDSAGRREFHWAIRVYSGRELETLLRQAGFQEVTLYGNLDGAPYDNSATRLIAVAQK